MVSFLSEMFLTIKPMMDKHALRCSWCNIHTGNKKLWSYIEKPAPPAIFQVYFKTILSKTSKEPMFHPTLFYQSLEEKSNLLMEMTIFDLSIIKKGNGWLFWKMFQIHLSFNFLAFLDFSDFRNPVYRRTNFSGISMEKGGNGISPKVYFSTSFQSQLWPYLWLCPFQLRLKNGHDNMPH